jgi:thiol-disulfide isomerase/thioredoxin
MQSYYEKYLKYKAKYLDLKNSSQYGAGLLVDQYANKDFSWFEEKPNRDVREKVLAELDSRLLKHERFTDAQLKTYYSALEGKYYRNRICESNLHSCPVDAAAAVVLAKRLLQETNNKALFEKYAVNINQHAYKQSGSGLLVETYADKDFSWFEHIENRDVREKVLAELDSRLLKHERFTESQLKTYYSALDGKYYRNRLCGSHSKSCPEDAAAAVVLAKRLLQETNNKALFEKYAFNINEHVSKLSGGGQEKPQIYLFKADWCGHCKGFKPLWEKLQKEHSSKYEFITVDADKNKKEISEWGIKGFPTIIKKVSNNAEEYVGPRDEASVVSFIEAN